MEETTFVTSYSTVLPEAVGYCDDQALYLVLKRGNVDQDWLPFVGDEHLTQEMAQRLGYSRQDNGTHLALRVPRHAAHLTYEVNSNTTLHLALLPTLPSVNGQCLESTWNFGHLYY